MGEACDLLRVLVGAGKSPPFITENWAEDYDTPEDFLAEMKVMGAVPYEALHGKNIDGKE